jgi:hypothetical protein
MVDPHERRTIYEVCRRYAACLYAMSDILGIDPYTMLTKHREVVSNCFQQASREGIRLRSDIDIPKLSQVILCDEWRRAS